MKRKTGPDVGGGKVVLDGCRCEFGQFKCLPRKGEPVHNVVLGQFSGEGGLLKREPG